MTQKGGMCSEETKNSATINVGFGAKPERMLQLSHSIKAQATSNFFGRAI